MTLAIIGLVGALVIPQLAGSDRGGGDSAARQALSAMILNQGAIFSVDGSFSSDPERLAAMDNERSFVSAEENSTKTSEISIAGEGSIIASAVRGTGLTCWYLRKNFDAPVGGEVWAYKDDTTNCRAVDALSLSSLESATNDGSSPSKPINLN